MTSLDMLLSSPIISKPCIKPEGPQPAKILIVGEAPGETEEREGRPFVGASGKELDRMLAEAGLDRAAMRLTNVFLSRPKDNKIETFMVPIKEATPESKALGPMRAGKYCHPALLSEVRDIEAEIIATSPHLVLALGSTALWALTGESAISKFRGTVLAGRSGTKVLPTFHPSAVLRQWDLRSTVLSDLLKAERQSHFPEIRRPSREIWIDPSLPDIRRWMDSDLTGARLLAVDVETRNKQITEIGFAASRHRALVVPFIRGFKEDYWKSLEEEVAAWHLVQEILLSPVEKLFQNGMYDLQYIYRWGMRVNLGEGGGQDTMLLHHALYPELPKGLGFLGSIYTDEASWKIMRNRKDSEKADDE